MPDWPHSPVHRLDKGGAYMVTAATFHKEPFFRSAARLTLLTETLLRVSRAYNWKLEAWAVFPNHYHFIAKAGAPATLPRFIGYLHTATAAEINRQYNSPRRKIWFQYWDTQLTYQRSYHARLNYVHCNAVHHQLVREPTLYQWCSAAIFQRDASRAFVRTVMQIPSDQVRVTDDFVVHPEDVC